VKPEKFVTKIPYYPQFHYIESFLEKLFPNFTVNFISVIFQFVDSIFLLWRRKPSKSPFRRKPCFTKQENHQNVDFEENLRTVDFEDNLLDPK